jgi:hypothetical protein
MQHVYMVLIYMFIHTYQSKYSCTLCVIFLATTIQLIKYDTCLEIWQVACGHMSLFSFSMFSKLKIHWINLNH